MFKLSRPALISSFCSMKGLEVFLLPTGWDVSPSQVWQSTKFAGTHLYTWVEKGTVKVKCLAQEHNTMTPAKAQIRTARSGVQSTNHSFIASSNSAFTKGVNYLQCTVIGPSSSCCSYVLCTWPIKSSMPSPLLEILSVQP